MIIPQLYIDTCIHVFWYTHKAICLCHFHTKHTVLGFNWKSLIYSYCSIVQNCFRVFGLIISRQQWSVNRIWFKYNNGPAMSDNDHLKIFHFKVIKPFKSTAVAASFHKPVVSLCGLKTSNYKCLPFRQY